MSVWAGGWGVSQKLVPKNTNSFTPRPRLSALHMPKPKNPPQKVALYTDLMPKELREALLDYLDRLEFPAGPEVEYEVIREQEKGVTDARFYERTPPTREMQKQFKSFVTETFQEKRKELGKRMKRYGPVRAAISKTQRPKRDSKKKRVDFVALEKVNVHKH